MKHSRLAAGLLTAALLAAPIAGFAQGYNNGAYHGHRTQTSGVISNVTSGAITLRSGQTIFLRNGTVINPTGAHLRPGMQISVTGTRTGNGNVNANEVDVAYHGHYHN
jgi:hypothetical protein